ncbi:unnamed protein product [Durusdinium trenchii]|uniref:Uncharacterized protein n=1 Tax=Durusdinium trenchii TaxID=1381693 RepID=A0ABP0M6K1_9DINO
MRHWLGLDLPWSCSCTCPGQEDVGDDRADAVRFVDDLEELTNADVLLEKAEANALPSGSHLTILATGPRSLTQLLWGVPDAAPGSRRQGRCVSHWEPYDGSMSILEIQASTGLPAQDEARELLSDLYLLAPRGINVLLYVLPFGTVSEELMHRLVFLLQYLLGNEILLNLYVVVTEAPSSLQSSDDAVEWVQSFADQDSGFRHLFTLAGKNPSRFIILGKAIQEDERRATVWSACGRHPVKTMPAFIVKNMQQVLSAIKVERDRLDEKEYKVACLRAEVERRSQSQHVKDLPRLGRPHLKAAMLATFALVPDDDLNTKVEPQQLETRHLCREVRKAEREVEALQQVIEKKLQEVRKASFFQEQVADHVESARRRYQMDLEVGSTSRDGSHFVNSLGSKYFNAFGRKEIQQERPGSFQGFATLSASLAMANSEDRPPSLIFDWDDTLCPTSWLRKLPGDAKVANNMKLELHAGRIEQVLRAARSFGYVDIVTLANRQWLDQTIHLLKSSSSTAVDLWALFGELGIRVHYAHNPHLPMRMSLSKPLDNDGILAKKVAMSAVLDRYYGDSVKARVHAMSFGDQDTEATALQEVMKEAWSKSWQRPISKVVRLPVEPDLQELGQSLQKILAHLPALVRVDADLDLDLRTLDRHRW